MLILLCQCSQLHNIQIFEGPNSSRETTFLASKTLKLSYSKVETQNLSGGNTPGPPLQGGGGKGKGKGWGGS